MEINRLFFDNHGWYADYVDGSGAVCDDSEKVWHPEMPTSPDAGREARAIAEAYCADR
jgi:hypothetical protein